MKVVVGKTSFKNSPKTKWKQCELALRNIIYIIFFIQSLVTKLLLFLISKFSFELLLQNSEKFQYFLIFFLRNTETETIPFEFRAKRVRNDSTEVQSSSSRNKRKTQENFK